MCSCCSATRQVKINRPDKMNAMNSSFFVELRGCFDRLAIDKGCRAIVLCGSGAEDLRVATIGRKHRLVKETTECVHADDGEMNAGLSGVESLPRNGGLQIGSLAVVVVAHFSICGTR